jgi:hypothetical protein
MPGYDDIDHDCGTLWLDHAPVGVMSRSSSVKRSSGTSSFAPLLTSIGEV